MRRDKSKIDIDEALKTKHVKSFKLQLNGVFSPFNTYGLGDGIPGAIEEVTELALMLHKNLNGDNIPLTYEEAKRKARNRKNGR